MSHVRQEPQGGNSATNPSGGGPEELTRDLFDRGEPFYPAAPGFAKGSETSRAAANEIFDFARGAVGKVARRLVDIHPRGETPDEVAEALGLSILTTRPRFTQLSAAGLIEKTGDRRPTRGLVSGAKRENFKSDAWRASPLLMSKGSPSIVPSSNDGSASDV